MDTTAVTIVTGASQGFGELTARELARRGHHVFAGVRGCHGRNAAVAEQLRVLAAAEGLALEPIELDVTDDASVDEAVERACASAGRIDAVVNNAGALFFGVTEAFTVEQVRDQLDVNVLGAVRLNRAVLPHMRDRGSGLLVHVGSIAGRLTWPFYTVYCASKYALEALAEGLRYELSALGIDSIIVEPGPFPTNLVPRRQPPGDRTRVAAYGTTALTAAGFIDAVEQFLAGDDAPDPQAVADVIADLVETPAGERPLRTVVEPGFGTDSLNDAAAPHAQAALDAFGFGHLAAIPTAATVPAASPGGGGGS